MACGHQEISRIALHSLKETIFTPLYNHTEERATNETHICNNVCQPSEDFSPQEMEVRSGEMCRPCQIATGEISDNLVRDVDGAETSDDEQWMMMSGGLNANTINMYPENALDDLLHDVTGEDASHGQQRMISGEPGPDLADIYPENSLDDFADGTRAHPMNSATLDAYICLTDLLGMNPCAHTRIQSWNG